MGNVGGVGTSNATDYTSAYNARVSSGREEVSVNRPNRGIHKFSIKKPTYRWRNLIPTEKQSHVCTSECMAANTTKEMYGQ